MIPELLKALQREESEFVRPALIRALAAQGADTRVRDTLLVEVGRGQDFFRSAVIEALGDYRAPYAVDPLIAIAKLTGPLQVDAIIALGKLKDQRAMETLASLQRSAEREIQPTIAAAICLLGVNCDSHLTYVVESLKFAEQNIGYQELLRNSVAGLVALANNGNAAGADGAVRRRHPFHGSAACADGSWRRDGRRPQHADDALLSGKLQERPGCDRFDR